MTDFPYSTTTVLIRINGYTDFVCPTNWTIEQAETRIRSDYGLLNGFTRRNGHPMLPNDRFTEDGV